MSFLGVVVNAISPVRSQLHAPTVLGLSDSEFAGPIVIGVLLATGLYFDVLIHLGDGLQFYAP